jgi:membrane associated rhomboid family serine protease
VRKLVGIDHHLEKKPVALQFSGYDCSACGNKLLADSKFCRQCGQPVDTTEKQIKAWESAYPDTGNTKESIHKEITPPEILDEKLRTAQAKAVHFCAWCGGGMLKGALFCRKCGELRDPQDAERMAEKKKVWEWQRIQRSNHQPYFTIIWPTLVFLLWFFGAFAEMEKDENKLKSWSTIQAGLDTISPGNTLLQVHSVCDDYRVSFWLYRCYLYQFTHTGFAHVLGNCVITWVLGIRLEKLHGTIKMALFFNIGVIGGACCYYVASAHDIVVGMSGGVYALQGMHWAYLFLNWSEKRHPFLWALMLSCWIGFDLLNQYVLVEDGSNAAKVSGSTHLGGAAAGFLVATMSGENLVEKPWEKHRKWIAGALLFGLWCFCFFWGWSWPPKTVFDTSPWCWKQLVFNSSHFGDANWHCVRCGNREGSTCIETWQSQVWRNSVTLTDCLDKYGGWASSEY